MFVENIEEGYFWPVVITVPKDGAEQKATLSLKFRHLTTQEVKDVYDEMLPKQKSDVETFAALQCIVNEPSPDDLTPDKFATEQLRLIRKEMSAQFLPQIDDNDILKRIIIGWKDVMSSDKTPLGFTHESLIRIAERYQAQAAIVEAWGKSLKVGKPKNV
jgi:hypothetical protein